MLTLVEVLKRTETFLKGKGCERARLDAELIMGQVLGLERVQLYLNFDRPMTEAELVALREPVARRGAREPMAYILGEREFWSLTFKTGAGVLVPRPDTETLVEAALELVPSGERCFVADVGTGTGAIACAVASERPEARVYATDVSREALALAKENVAALGLGERVAVLGGELLSPIPAGRRVDVVLSNPPYIATAELDGLMPEVAKWEPRLALDGGVDGLDVYRALVPAAFSRAQVAVAVEIGHDQGSAVSELFRAAGAVDVEVRKDLGGNDRVVVGRVA